MTDAIPANGNGKARPAILSDKSLITLGQAVVFLATAITFKTWIDTQFSTLSGEIAELKFQMRTYETSMNLKTVDRWTSKDMRLFVSEMARKNPALVVPSVSEILSDK